VSDSQDKQVKGVHGDPDAQHRHTEMEVGIGVLRHPKRAALGLTGCPATLRGGTQCLAGRQSRSSSRCNCASSAGRPCPDEDGIDWEFMAGGSPRRGTRQCLSSVKGPATPTLIVHNHGKVWRA